MRSGAGPRQQPLGLGKMQPLDHAAVERDHALAGIFGQREGGDDRAGLPPAPRRTARRPRWPARSGWDGSASCRRNPSRRLPRIRARRRPASRKSLTTPSSAASPPARAASTICISQRHEIAAVGRGADAGVLGEVVGAGDQAGQPRRRVAAELGDGADVEQRPRRLDHRPERRRVRHRRRRRARRRPRGCRAACRPWAAGWRRARSDPASCRSSAPHSPASGLMRMTISGPPAAAIVMKEALRFSRAADLLARRHRVLQVEDHRVAGERGDLGQRPLVGGRNIEHGTARAVAGWRHAAFLPRRDRSAQPLAGPP